MGSFGAIGGMGAASVAGTVAAATGRGSSRSCPPTSPGRSRRRIRGCAAGSVPDEAPPALLTLAPAANPAAQARTAFDDHYYEAAAVLHGPLDRPTILYGARGSRAADYLALLAQTTLAAQQLGGSLPRIDVTRQAIVPPSGDRGGAAPVRRFSRCSGSFS